MVYTDNSLSTLNFDRPTFGDSMGRFRLLLFQFDIPRLPEGQTVLETRLSHCRGVNHRHHEFYIPGYRPIEEFLVSVLE